MAKRILIYTNHFYPEQFKINEIVEWISTEDFSVRVVTCIPNYPQGKFYKGYGLKSIRSTFFKDNVIVNRLPLIPRGNANFFLRSLNYISYFISTFFFTIYLLIFKTKYDYVFVHHTSPILIAVSPIIYKLFYRSKLIMWDLDLWPDTLKSLGFIKSRYLFLLIENLVKTIYNFYDKILIGSKKFEKIIEKRFTKEIIYFPNWAEKTIERNLVDFNITNNLPKDDFIITYTGNIGLAQGFDIIVKLIHELRSEKIHWVFIGEGSYKATFLKNLESFHVINKCSFINQVDIDKIPTYVSFSNALLVSLINNSIFEKTVPAKLQSYMAMKKPVIGLISGEGADIINKSNSGIYSKSSDYKELSLKIKKFIRLDKSELDKIGRNGYIYYHEHFSSSQRRSPLLRLFK